MMASALIPGAPGVGAERVIQAVAQAAASWLGGDWPDQQGLGSRMAAHSGFSPAVVRAGMAAHFAAMSADELRRWMGQVSGSRGIGRSVAILPAADLPGIGLVPAVAALLAGSRVLIKTSAAEPYLMCAWKECLVSLDADLEPWIEVTEWTGGDDPQEESRLAGCDRIVLLGADTTIVELGRRYGHRLIGFGTGNSLAVVSDGAELGAAARRLARDVAIWDQKGCLSPHGIVVVGSEKSAQTLRSCLADAMQDIESELPVGPLSVAEAATLRVFRADLSARRLAGEPVDWCDSGEVAHPARWLVWWDQQPAFETSPGRRHVRVWRVSTPDELIARALPPCAQLQAVGLDRSDPAAAALTAALRAAGVPVIASLGSMQAPPVDWPNKGRHLLRELTDGVTV
jgi:hypothetical protein